MPKIIRDPIYDIIEIEDEILPIIDSYAFQRLRRIKQLGIAWLVYPSAEHSRFTHSLGTYEMSKRLITVLRQNSLSSLFSMQDDEEKAVRIAALLHDIGHAPFSHVIEGVSKSLGYDFKHEKMTYRILEECQELKSNLVRVLGENIVRIVYEILSKRYSNVCVSSIVSSQFDADRLDYLLRDSYMTGANYGTFDYTWLLRNIRMTKATLPKNVEGQTVLAVEFKKGLNVLEQYLLGRYYMYTHVYYHKTVRSFEAILKNLLKRVIDTEQACLPGYLKIRSLVCGFIDVSDFIKLDDTVLLAWLNEWYWTTKDRILKYLLKCFLNREPFTTIIPPQDLVGYSRTKEDILSRFEGTEQRKYLFYEDTQENVAYKDLYMTKDVLEEIFIIKDDNVAPLSGIRESVIKQAADVLYERRVRLYIAPELA